jgi:hypothetical protein
MDQGMPGLEGDVASDHAADRPSQRRPVGEILRTPAVRVNDARDAGTMLGYGKLFGARPLRQGASGRTDDGLGMSTGAQTTRQRQQGFLPASPVACGVDVDDREGLQKNDSTMVT